MTTVVNGVLGGLFAASVAMIIARSISGESSFADGLLTLLGIESDTNRARWQGLAVTLIYGALAGGAVVALELFVFEMISVPPSVSEAFALALLWAGLLFLVALVLVRLVTPPAFGRAHIRELIFYHTAYGFALGVWIRFTWIT